MRRRPELHLIDRCPSVQMDLMHVDQPLTGSAWAFGVFAVWLTVCTIPVGQPPAVYRDEALRISVAIGLAPGVSSGVRGPTLQPGDDRRGVADVVRSPMAPRGNAMVRGCGDSGPFTEHRGWLVRRACAWRELMAAAVPQRPPSILA